MSKNIELELRAEIKSHDFKKTLEKLKGLGKLISKTRRLSVMCFGKIKENSLDIRVRITNGKAEVVIKKGSLYSHDRTEISQAISKKQFMGMAQAFIQLGFDSKIGERETFNFDLGNNVIASLVKAKMISYIELEKMSSKNDLNKNRKELEKIVEGLKLKIIKTSAEFDELCDRLDKKVDWNFSGSKGDYKKLERILQKY